MATMAANPVAVQKSNWALPGTLKTPAPNSDINSFTRRTTPNTQGYLKGTQLQSPIDLQRFKGIGADLYGKLFRARGPGLKGGVGDGNFSFTSGYAGADDPNFQRHLANLKSGTLQIANKAADESAFGGAIHADQGVPTGDARSGSAYSLAKAIADSYANQYKTSADLTYRDNALGAQNTQSAMSLLASIYGNDAALQKAAADFSLGQGRIGVDLSRQELEAAQAAEAFNQKKYFSDLEWDRGAAEREWQKRQQAQQQSVWNRSKEEMLARDQQADRDKATVSMYNMRGGGWLGASEAGDAAMRRAVAEGRDWWRDPARGGGGGGGGFSSPNTGASWAGFTSGLLNAAKA